MRYFFLLLLIGTSIAVFVAVIKPHYNALSTTKDQINAESANLETASKLKQSRDDLISTYNSIPKTDIDNLKTLLPDSVDNIRLIIQIDALATKNGLSILHNVDYAATDLKDTASTPGTAPNVLPGETPESARNPFGEFDMSFETVGQYKNFLTFLSDLEQNLRLIDVVSVDFTPNITDQGPTNNITYKVKLKTYWLKQQQ